MTDGKFYIGESGELFKVFYVQDGCGIKEILPKHNIIPVVMTARIIGEEHIISTLGIWNDFGEINFKDLRDYSCHYNS